MLRFGAVAVEVRPSDAAADTKAQLGAAGERARGLMWLRGGVGAAVCGLCGIAGFGFLDFCFAVFRPAARAIHIFAVKVTLKPGPG